MAENQFDEAYVSSKVIFNRHMGIDNESLQLEIMDISGAKLLSGTIPTTFVLVGNKSDNKECRQVTAKEGQDLAQSLDCPFFEATASEFLTVERAFRYLVRVIRARTKSNEPKTSSTTSSTKSKKKDDNCRIA
eukprot:gene13755-16223_t